MPSSGTPLSKLGKPNCTSLACLFLILTTRALFWQVREDDLINIAFADRGELDTATSLYSKALQIEPDYAMARKNRELARKRAARRKEKAVKSPTGSWSSK